MTEKQSDILQIIFLIIGTIFFGCSMIGGFLHFLMAIGVLKK